MTFEIIFCCNITLSFRGVVEHFLCFEQRIFGRSVTYEFSEWSLEDFCRLEESEEELLLRVRTRRYATDLALEFYQISADVSSKAATTIASTHCDAGIVAKHQAALSYTP